MRLSTIMGLIKEYLPLGIIVSVMLVLFFLFGWLVVYKKIFKGKKVLNRKMLILSLVFIGYFFVVAVAVFLNRYSGPRSMNLHLFSTYRAAWNVFSSYEWRNIILNILLFLPLGILLPIGSDRFKKLWKTVLAGFGMTLAIELIQRFTGRGVFDVDDIFNNTLGTLIGYGLIMAVFTLKGAKKKKALKAAAYALPFLAVLIAFSAVFIAYRLHEFGNLAEASRYTIPMNNVELTSNVLFSEKEESKKVYYSEPARPNETLAFAQAFFKNFKTDVDESKTDSYEDTVIYQSTAKRLSLWVNYKGKTYSFNDLSADGSIDDRNPDENSVRLALTRLGVSVPDNAKYSLGENNTPLFTANMLDKGDALFNGTLRCRYCTDGTIRQITNSIIAYTPVKECPVISQAEAYEKIKSGNFSYYSQNRLDSIEINRVELLYRMDSKGYFQPAYLFTGLLNGEGSAILIPALRR